MPGVKLECASYMKIVACTISQCKDIEFNKVHTNRDPTAMRTTLDYSSTSFHSLITSLPTDYSLAPF
jgi:hypothetical protein